MYTAWCLSDLRYFILLLLPVSTFSSPFTLFLLRFFLSFFFLLSLHFTSFLQCSLEPLVTLDTIMSVALPLRSLGPCLVPNVTRAGKLWSTHGESRETRYVQGTMHAQGVLVSLLIEGHDWQ